MSQRPTKVFVKLRKNQTAFPLEHLHSELVSLEISAEGLKELPEEIGQCSKLELLSINTPLVEWLPKSLWSLKHLKTLKINAAIDELNKDDPMWDNLVNLQINNSSLMKLPNWFKNLKKLEYLNLSSNQLIEVPSYFKDLSSLKRLNLDNNKIKAFNFDSNDLNSLNHLSLDGNPFSEDEIARIERVFGIWF